jgi:hypothetical protein
MLRLAMIRSRSRIVLAIILAVLFSSSRVASGSDVDMKILSYPDHISKFSEFYVRVKITNNGETPLRGCDKSEEKCMAVGWDFVERTVPLTVPSKNIASLQPYVANSLLPGESIEKSIRIVPAGALNESEAVVSLSLILKDGPSFNLSEQRLKLPLRPPARSIQQRRVLVRTLVYSYFSLSAIMLGFLLLMQRRYG